ncbi:hypothetical protein BAE44_0008934 [Dichanthelium oligosanthes]|uniref:Uncharacterized protein n=1 Tax=Dichanthelium oligosanthes TaxID=888268 RepID=A0A1E5VY46_9POAL|nr:hypothetical protein BAE44_0008934 [Dichanthelium oligosanthes]
MAGGGLLGAAFWATRALQVVKRNDGPGLLWKRIKLTTTRKNNAKKRLKRLWQVRTSLFPSPSVPFSTTTPSGMMASSSPRSTCSSCVWSKRLVRLLLLESYAWYWFASGLRVISYFHAQRQDSILE